MKETSEEKSFCSHCGAPLKPGTLRLSGEALDQAKNARKWRALIYIVAAVVMLSGVVMAVLSFKTQKTVNTCQLYRKSGDYAQGVEICGQIVRKRPKVIAGWIELALSYEGLKDYKNAQTTVGQALKWGPGNAELHALSGKYCYINGNRNKALGELKKALAIDRTNRIANQYMGLTLGTKKKPLEAIPYLTRALKNAEYSDYMLINETLGDIYMRQKKYPEAEKYYRQILEKDMNLIPVSIKMINNLIMQNKLAEASREAYRALQIDPQNDSIATLQSEVAKIAERAAKIDYIANRKECDDQMNSIYEAFLSHLDAINSDPNAFYGETDTELDMMINDMESVKMCYQKLRPPYEYSYVYAINLKISVLLSDTLQMLKRYLADHDSQQRFSSLSRQIEGLDKQYKDLLALWAKEYSDPAIKTAVDEKMKMRREYEKERARKPNADTGTKKPAARHGK